MLVQEPVQAAVWHCLNHYAYNDAIFLAERLVAEVETDESLHLLATCYYRSGKTSQAYSILLSHSHNSPHCDFLLAKCCVELNKLAEAEEVLTRRSVTKGHSLDDIVSHFAESSSFILQLLAKIFTLTDRHTKAVEAYKKSLKLNPFLWNSFESLCNIGEKPDPGKIFQTSNLDNFNMCHGTNMVVKAGNGTANSVNDVSGMLISSFDSQNNSHNNSTPIHSTYSSHISSLPQPPSLTMTSSYRHMPMESENSLSWSQNVVTSSKVKMPPTRSIFGGFSLSPLTPSFGVLPLDTPSPGDGSYTVLTPSPAYTPQLLEQSNIDRTIVKKVVNRKEPFQVGKLSVFSQSGNTSNSMNVSQGTSPTVPQLLQGQNVRRSTRLFSSNNSVKENNKGPAKPKISAVPRSPSRKTKSRLAKTGISQPTFEKSENEKNKSDKERTEKSESLGNDLKYFHLNNQNLVQQAFVLQKQSAEGLMQLLRELGLGYLHLAQYNCRKAIDILNSIPSQQHNSGWVLSLLGKAYFELADYPQAARYFSEVRYREPYRMQYMEYYSTALWHLQREVELSALAHELVEHDRHALQAWLAVGNCSSLQKEHENAIKFFQRALQLDPQSAYTYTLLGDEYASTEELDKAMDCFRNAVRLDPRRYNAWCGMATVYYKQEKCQLAEVYFKKALVIHPQNSVLMCHLAVVQHALQRSDQALNTLNRALTLDPKNPVCKFHRGSIYFAMDRHAEALQEFQELKEIVPKESLVYFLTGKVYKKMGKIHKALMHFSWAMDLDPKGANTQIKEASDPSVCRILVEDDDVLDESDVPVQQSSSQESVESPPVAPLDSI